MGPGDGIQIQRLMDLPTTLETAEPDNRVVVVERGHVSQSHLHTSVSQSGASLVASQQAAGVQRVKSLLQTTGGGGKLPSRLPPGGGQPQRSISHNEVRDSAGDYVCWLAWAD